ncbi:MAG: tetratricopeptide repeat protein [Deltaproteobacteria bacterium]|nr:tetratricopeptide repeat protein [Deltaproteobacteria bacterium]
MKSQLGSILFGLLVSISACGGDRGNSTPTATTPPSSSKPELGGEPVVEVTPKVVKVGSEPTVELATKYVDALAMGKQLAEQGEHPRARELFEAAAKLGEQQADPHIELARSYIVTNDRALAIKSANKAVKLAPESSQAYNTLGRAELLRHGYDDAIVAFRQATELNADNVWAWNNLGYTHLLLKQYQEAADALAEATSRKGATGYMWNNLGTAYEHLDQLDDARVAFESGGTLGSSQALASRKRLEGVDTIVVMKDPPTSEPKVGAEGSVIEHGYEHSEPMPELPVTEVIEDDEDVSEEPKVEESGVDAVREIVDDEPKVDEPTVEPKVDAVETEDVPVVL